MCTSAGRVGAQSREHSRTLGEGLRMLPAFLSEPREKLPTFTPVQSSLETRKGVEVFVVSCQKMFVFPIGKKH